MPWWFMLRPSDTEIVVKLARRAAGLGHAGMRKGRLLAEIAVARRGLARP